VSGLWKKKLSWLKEKSKDMKKIPVTADILYTNGCSWTHGSELIDPDYENPNHFAAKHEEYRLSHFWPKLLANKLGLDLQDASHPGGSNDRILRTTIQDVSRLIEQGRRPFVVVAWSQLQRFELPEGPKGEFWRSFVSPKNPGEPRVAMDTWREWSSNRSDVVKWIQQLISLDNFLKINQVEYLGTTVFDNTFRLYEDQVVTDQDCFGPYLYQLRKHVGISRHALNVALETVLRQHENVAYGTGGHPLRRGHELIAEQLEAQLSTRFQIQRHQV